MPAPPCRRPFFTRFLVATPHPAPRSERGLFLPLEVFRTRSKGWGLRCAEDIPSGAFVCSYEGELITNREAVSCGQRASNAKVGSLHVGWRGLLFESCAAPRRRRAGTPAVVFDRRSGGEPTFTCSTWTTLW